MASLVGNPQDIISTPYGYSGQMAPETAIAEQALNRRRLLANMLTQQGMQPQQGRMVGRFFVGPSPVQGGAGLAQVLAGGLGNRAIDSKQKALMDEDRNMVIKAIQDWKAKQQQSAAVAQAPANAAPSQAAAAPVPAEQAPPTAPLPLPEGSPDMGPPLQNIGPRPQQPAPNMVVPSDPKAFLNQPPVDYRDPAAQRVSQGTDPSGIDMAHAAPGDMSTMIGTDDPAKAQAQLGDQQPSVQPPAQVAPAPAAPPMAPPQMAAAPRKTTMDDLAELLTHQHPQVRAYGSMLAQQMQKDQDREHQQNFLSQEKALDREVRRDGILENSRLREAQMQNTMALTKMQIDAMQQRGQDANELKASLAQQQVELQKLQMKTSAELKKAEMGSRADTAKQHDETLKAIAQMNADSRKDLAAMKTDAKQGDREKAIRDVQGTIAILRDSYDQLDKGGGITNTDKSGVTNLSAAASSSAPGQMIGKMLGTKNQSARNTIEQSRPLLMANIMRAMGITAKQLDSNAELKLWLNAATDPTLDLQANKNALDHLETMIGDGGTGQAGVPTPAPASAAAPAMKNAKGWTLHTDAKGNKAYVSPDGKQFEEVR